MEQQRHVHDRGRLTLRALEPAELVTGASPVGLFTLGAAWPFAAWGARTDTTSAAVVVAAAGSIPSWSAVSVARAAAWVPVFVTSA